LYDRAFMLSGILPQDVVRVGAFDAENVGNLAYSPVELFRGAKDICSQMHHSDVWFKVIPLLFFSLVL